MKFVSIFAMMQVQGKLMEKLIISCYSRCKNWLKYFLEGVCGVLTYVLFATNVYFVLLSQIAIRFEQLRVLPIREVLHSSESRAM